MKIPTIAFKAIAIIATIYTVLTFAALAFATLAFVVSAFSTLLGLAVQAIPVAVAFAVACWAIGKLNGTSAKEVAMQVRTRSLAHLGRTTTTTTDQATTA
jgi:orotate phosphoribosyltransferase